MSERDEQVTPYAPLSAFWVMYMRNGFPPPHQNSMPFHYYSCTSKLRRGVFQPHTSLVL